MHRRTKTNNEAGTAPSPRRLSNRRHARGKAGPGEETPTRERRPAQGEIAAAVPGLVARRGAEIRATARGYAATPEDAEDAYQRGLEILLTKAPSTSDSDLVPWLKTVLKHEAFSVRRHRERHAPVTDDGELGDRATPTTITADQAERYERLRQGAETLGQLKPQERRALLLRAQGYSYAEICAITGWTYTKVYVQPGPSRRTRRLAAVASARKSPVGRVLLPRDLDSPAVRSVTPAMDEGEARTQRVVRRPLASADAVVHVRGVGALAARPSEQ
jgi:RNA polymerase sigma factor (sigma-70 family)